MAEDDPTKPKPPSNVVDFEAVRAKKLVKDVATELKNNPDAFLFSEAGLRSMQEKSYECAKRILDSINESTLNQNVLFTYRGNAAHYQPSDLSAAIEAYEHDPSSLQKEEAYALAEQALKEFKPPS